MNIKLQDTTVYRLPDKEESLDEFKVRGHENSDTTIVALKGKDGMSAEEDELLKNLVSAIQRSPEETPVFAIGNEDVLPFYKLTKVVSSQYFLFFGVNPKQLFLNLEVKQNQPVHLGDVQLIFTDSLADLVADPSAKAPLWKALQKMFGLK